MVAHLTKTGADSVLNDNKSHSNIIEGNKMLSSDSLTPEPVELSSNQNKQKDIDIIPFTEHSENVCLSIIDIVGSTNIVSTIRRSKDIRKFYEIYINKITNLIKSYRAKIIKTVGDGIISYFPDTVDTSDVKAFENVLKCCFAQIDERSSINSTLIKEGLPTIRYRISVDFGKVERARLKGFDSDDLFGTTVNVCSKMNLFAPPNSIVVGSDFYRIIKSFKQFPDTYTFHDIGSYHCGAGKFSYPLYSVSRMNLSKVMHVNPIAYSLHEIDKYVGNRINPSRIPKILLIDDELDDLFVLEEYLRYDGFEVKSFPDPREALRHYQIDPSSYDLVICDIRMPEINGFELYYKLKSVNDSVKVLFATCLEIVDEILTLIPGIQPEQLVQKPVEKESFIKIVKKNIG
jgi:two-component system, OmpR family, response regulator ChvI